jgi:hypothetical protein
MRFVPYHQLADTPNIIVDGAAQQATVLTLSHWPRNTTPAALKADLSAQIVFHYLQSPTHHVDVPAVSNNHFDEDGLVSLYSILNPDQAIQLRAFLIDVAAAGDFGTYRNREAARVLFVLGAFADAERSPLDRNIFKQSYPEQTASLYHELLPRLPEFYSNIESFRELWQQEDQTLTACEHAIRDGLIGIEEHADLDLAIVTLPQQISEYHPLALHNATNCFRILTIAGKKYEMKYRYETWVQYMSRRPLPRVDLTPLAEQLSEEDGAQWQFDGVNEIVPRLYRNDGQESRLSPEQYRSKVIRFLEV